jgi:hypothetical protein
MSVEEGSTPPCGREIDMLLAARAGGVETGIAAGTARTVSARQCGKDSRLSPKQLSRYCLSVPQSRIIEFILGPSRRGPGNGRTVIPNLAAVRPYGLLVSGECFRTGA